MKLRWCFGRWGNTQNQKQTSHTFWQLIRYVNESRYKSRTVIVVADSAQAKEEASPSPSRAAPVHYTIVGIEYQKQITRALGRNEKTCEEKEDQEKKRNKKVTFFCKLEKKSAAAACRRGQIKTRDAATPSPGDDYPGNSGAGEVWRVAREHVFRGGPQWRAKKWLARGRPYLIFCRWGIFFFLFAYRDFAHGGGHFGHALAVGWCRLRVPEPGPRSGVTSRGWTFSFVLWRRRAKKRKLAVGRRKRSRRRWRRRRKKRKRSCKV